MSSATSTITVQSPPVLMDYPRNIFNDKPNEPQSSTALLSPVVQSGTISPINTTSVVQQKCSFHRQCTRTADLQHNPVQAQQFQTSQQVLAATQIVQQQQQLQSSPQPSTPLTHQQQLLQQHQQLQQQSRLNNSLNTNVATVAAKQVTRDAISTNTLPQLNAALLQDRYLLLDLVDGSSFYKCVDITTQKMLVCKVSVFCL